MRTRLATVALLLAMGFGLVLACNAPVHPDEYDDDGGDDDSANP